MLFMCLLIGLNVCANDSTKLYNPYADVSRDLKLALERAKKEKKHVLLQIGGNWCVSCYRYNATVQTDSLLKRLLYDNYVVYYLNYSNENKNLEYMKRLGYPQRFGFPVMVVLDADGKQLHTQDSALLGKGNGYDTNKIKSFLRNWAPGAFDAAFYIE